MKFYAMLPVGLVLGLVLGRMADAISPMNATNSLVQPPADASRFEIFLLVGQSNMAGRGTVAEADRVADSHVLVLNAKDEWVVEGEPIHFDKPGMAGVGPGYTFGKLLAARQPGVTIGLIPGAFGGTSLAQWDPKSTDKTLYSPYSLYENAIRRTQLVIKKGTLKGILWHQGEGDAAATPGTYAARLMPLVASFRADLPVPSLPFIAGELGHFCCGPHPGAATINEQINRLPKLIPDCAVVSAVGLSDKGDQLHFSAEAQREMGRRYLAAYLKLTRP